MVTSKQREPCAPPLTQSSFWIKRNSEKHFVDSFSLRTALVIWADTVGSAKEEAHGWLSSSEGGYPVELSCYIQFKAHSVSNSVANESNMPDDCPMMTTTTMTITTTLSRVFITQAYIAYMHDDCYGTNGNGQSPFDGKKANGQSRHANSCYRPACTDLRRPIADQAVSNRHNKCSVSKRAGDRPGQLQAQGGEQVELYTTKRKHRGSSGGHNGTNRRRPPDGYLVNPKRPDVNALQDGLSVGQAKQKGEPESPTKNKCGQGNTKCCGPQLLKKDQIFKLGTPLTITAFLVAHFGYPYCSKRGKQMDMEVNMQIQ
ncbi:hypothetical protein TTRE_0000218301 [Trichuris trichiura]|uniref:Uncharacterized protein n=1 Tax=Trichuris trichiura TaxID=36087 RepID=A0A077Z1X6_TRITR|nr:hypothetical protein TTRE_0000218301 [Trichuris trichiura]